MPVAVLAMIALQILENMFDRRTSIRRTTYIPIITKQLNYTRNVIVQTSSIIRSTNFRFIQIKYKVVRSSSNILHIKRSPYTLFSRQENKTMVENIRVTVHKVKMTADMQEDAVDYATLGTVRYGTKKVSGNSLYQ